MLKPALNLAPAALRTHSLACLYGYTLLALSACGLETGPNPHKDSGVTSGSGAGGKGGSAADSGSSGNDGGKGGTSTSGVGGAGKAGSGTGGAGTGGGGMSGNGTGGAGSGGTETAGMSGSPDDAGTTPTGCTADATCNPDRPQCNADAECGACTNDNACKERDGLTRCALSGAQQGECVQCVEEADCTGMAATPHCVGNACGECASHADCVDPLKPQCSGGTCVGCTGNEACEGRASGEHCVADAAASDVGQCVACTEHAHCANPTPECGADHTCAGCTGNDACAGREGTTVCDQSSDQAFSGKCVQCTGTQYSGCGTDVPTGMPYTCNSLTRFCSDQPLHSRGPCKSCSSDAACLLGQRCVHETFQSQEFGYFCLWAIGSESTAPTDCATERPYVKQRDAVISIDGDNFDVCGLSATTCEGLNAFRAPPNCVDADACGLASISDSLCKPFTSGTDRCTIPCTTSDDCPTSYACNTDASPHYCDLQSDGCYADSDCPSGAPGACQGNHTCK